MANINATFGDREMTDDALGVQKTLTGTYNMAAGESANAALMNEFLTIYGEEHKLQLEIFTEMNKRGWYPVTPADQAKVQQAKDQFQNTNS